MTQKDLGKEEMTTAINLGLIGLGYIGKLHLRNCLKLESVDVVAVADMSKRALRLAREMGVKQTFEDYRPLLKRSDVDAVIISLPTHLHAPCAMNAAEEGKHVLLEKPLARNPEEGKKIISAVRKNDVKLMIGYPSRFTAQYCNLKKKVESGLLGDIQTAYAVNIASGPFLHRAEGATPRPVPEWWLKSELTGGGALMDLGSHMINLTRWCFGEVNNIKAYLGYRFNFDFEDHAICIADFTSGTTAVINLGWFSQRTAIGIELFGTVAHEFSYHSAPSRIVTAIQLLLGRTPSFFKPYQEEVSHFVHCIKEDSQPSSSGEDALKDLEAISMAYKNQILLNQSTREISCFEPLSKCSRK